MQMNAIEDWKHEVEQAMAACAGESFTFRPLKRRSSGHRVALDGQPCRLLSVLLADTPALEGSGSFPVYEVHGEGVGRFLAYPEEIGSSSVAVRQLLAVAMSGFEAAQELGFVGPFAFAEASMANGMLIKFKARRANYQAAGAPYQIDPRTEILASVMLGDVVGLTYEDPRVVPEWGWACLNAAYLSTADDSYDVLLDLDMAFAGDMGLLRPLIASLRRRGTRYLQLQHV